MEKMVDNSNNLRKQIGVTKLTGQPTNVDCLPLNCGRQPIGGRQIKPTNSVFKNGL